MSAVARRRAVLALVLVGIAVVLLAPTIRRIVRDVTLPLAYADVIRQQAGEKHLDPALIAAVIFAETKFDARTSPTGALGLMQIEPSTARVPRERARARPRSRSPTSRTRTRTSPTAATTCATCSTATAATRRWRWRRTTGARRTSTAGWRRRMPPACAFTVDAIPFAQTRAYVQRVEHAQVAYRSEYGL